MFPSPEKLVRPMLGGDIVSSGKRGSLAIIQCADRSEKRTRGVAGGEGSGSKSTRQVEYCWRDWLWVGRRDASGMVDLVGAWGHKRTGVFRRQMVRADGGRRDRERNHGHWQRNEAGDTRGCYTR